MQRDYIDVLTFKLDDSSVTFVLILAETNPLNIVVAKYYKK